MEMLNQAPLDSWIWPTLTAGPSASVILPGHLTILLSTFLHGSGSHAMLYKYSRTYGLLSRWHRFCVQAALCPEVQEPEFKVQSDHVLAERPGKALSFLSFDFLLIKHLCRLNCRGERMI